MADFSLHPQLARDCVVIGKFPLCLLLLMNDNQYPWFILVPQRPDISEIHRLSDTDQQQLMRESCTLGVAIEKAFHPDKINVAALGNVVSQLHVHHIARFEDDAAWPASVWGKLPTRPYTPEALDKVVERVLLELSRTDVGAVAFSV
ncbi:MAG TPA: HIT domain-containing protein [Mariprofundaceae bacterium]|nr:HIT domain-containing protein [Mariprofundaceae bacterium]